MTSFLSESAVYRQFLGDREDYTAETRDLRLSGVWIREIFAEEPENVETARAILYFFEGQSACFDGNGAEADFPRPKNGDRVILHPDSPDEYSCRIAEAASYTGTGIAPHIRLKLK